MPNTDSIRRRERERAAEAREQHFNRRRPEHTEFHETLAPAVPNRTYRSEVGLSESHAPATEQVIRFVATVLCSLLALRFLTSLFSANRTNSFVAGTYALTDWLVQPFQTIWGGTPASVSGFFDWPALAGIVTLAILATLLVRLVRTPRL